MAEFYDNVPQKIASGVLECHECVSRGLQSAGTAFVGMMMGKNIGKAVISLEDD